MLEHLRDPVYIRRPSQILNRIWYLIRGRRQKETVTLPWGGQLTVFGTEKNGRAILHRGVTELTVTESCFRLSEPETLAVDVGANIGHMTSALAHGMGRGDLYAFEPHPKLYPLLEKNVTQISSEVSEVSLSVHKTAVGRERGTQSLHIPEGWSENYGIATISGNSGSKGVQVEVCRLENEISNPVQVLKMDVEGHEEAVLEGAENLLDDGKVRHIIFEDHNFENSIVVEKLKKKGYNILGIEAHLSGPALSDASRTEGYNFIATLDENNCLSRFKSTGWRSLGK